MPILLLIPAILQAASPAAEPGAGVFPGLVPARAQRVTRTVDVNLARPGWQATGLYAVPGEPVRISIPPGAGALGLGLRIGAHSDELGHLPERKRAPEICRVAPLTRARMSATHVFGGPVYVMVPDLYAHGRVPVTVSGVVEMPRFVKGVTATDEWNRRIRRLPAPWAELESDRLIMTIPAEIAAGVRDPGRVLAFWDRVLAAQAHLAGARPHPRRKERIVADIQISAGYMHSGYPIMVHLDAAEVLVDPHRLAGDRRGGPGWGIFHELGHNLQSDDWTFDGTREVTCNLFALYAFDRVCGIAPAGTRGELAPGKRRTGATFDEWRADPFIALQPYVILQEEFGWDFYRKIFAAYRKLPDAGRPNTDADRIRVWIERTSKAAGRDLTAFWKEWGLAVSATPAAATTAR